VFVNEGGMSKEKYKQAKEHLAHQLDEQNKTLRECVPVMPEISDEDLISRCLRLQDKGWEDMPRSEKRNAIRDICPLLRVRFAGIGGKGGAAKTTLEPIGAFIYLGGKPPQVPSDTIETVGDFPEWQVQDHSQEWTSSEYRS
jgi:hypothetical protein